MRLPELRLLILSNLITVCVALPGHGGLPRAPAVAPARAGRPHWSADGKRYASGRANSNGVQRTRQRSSGRKFSTVGTGTARCLTATG